MDKNQGPLCFGRLAGAPGMLTTWRMIVGIREFVKPWIEGWGEKFGCPAFAWGVGGLDAIDSKQGGYPSAAHARADTYC